jgi:hypothetical protein
MKKLYKYFGISKKCTIFVIQSNTELLTYKNLIIMKTFEIFAKFDSKRNGKQVGLCPLINYDMQETAKVIAKSIIAMGYADDFMVREKKFGEDVTGLVQTKIDEILEQGSTNL